MASGASAPVRIIHGQHTKLTRTGHGIAYDAVRDEIFSSEALAGAIVVLKGGANGDATPIRVIQGPHTRLFRPWYVFPDDAHHELVVGDNVQGSVLTYPIDANGDVAPKRVIHGPKTLLFQTYGVGVDDQRDLLIAVSQQIPLNAAQKAAFPADFQAKRHGGILIFHRTDNGNVAPFRVIMGPHTGIQGPGNIQMYKGLIFMNTPNAVYYHSAYDLGGYAPRKDCTGPPPDPLGLGSQNVFIGVWDDTQNGDVGPHYVIHGPASQFAALSGIAIDPKDGEVYVTDAVHNATFGFLVPDFFTPKQD
ncbi:MAG TPA: hypothetical protein VKV28_08540 [Candidatus Binataceae bacterium]|nr:hypothetical protein [Candidatus Binataceae bacterium]